MDSGGSAHFSSVIFFISIFKIGYVLLISSQVYWLLLSSICCLVHTIINFLSYFTFSLLKKFLFLGSSFWLLFIIFHFSFESPYLFFSLRPYFPWTFKFFKHSYESCFKSLLKSTSGSFESVSINYFFSLVWFIFYHFFLAQLIIFVVGWILLSAYYRLEFVIYSVKLSFLF